MTRSAQIALQPPGRRDWDFGDYPYALEPLTLTEPGTDLTPADAQEEIDSSYAALVADARNGLLTTEPVTGSTQERLFWFRWITGHQISFIIWRLLATAIKQLSHQDADKPAISAAITQYVRGYCGMLLYTGSSTREIYNETIRPSMYRQHNVFSGTWARDYPPVRSLFHGRKVPPVAASELDALVDQVRLGQQIHVGVAAKLVVDGKSLLQHAVAARSDTQPRMWGAMFDCYFLTLRAPVTSAEIVAQLLRRQKAVAADLATNGLYPGGDADHVPPELLTPEVLECEDDLTASLFRVAGLATGLGLDDVTKRWEYPCGTE